ncbi:MAG: hypothetical protein ACRDNS_00595, partial [Trebonia sp.]
ATCSAPGSGYLRSSAPSSVSECASTICAARTASWLLAGGADLKAVIDRQRADSPTPPNAR